MKNIVIGMLAHVDAGKTTLTESLLYATKSIRKLGRVDHKDAFLDYDNQERNRGITIYTKQAYFNYGNTNFFLIDTPGHVDFSSEMERSLVVLDYAIIIISALDGVQSQTKKIFDLLALYQVPCIIFVNKMDIAYQDEKTILKNIQENLTSDCLKLNDVESMALLDEKMMEYYLENGMLSDDMIASLIADRKLFPCLFGSALKQDNIIKLLHVLDEYTMFKVYDDNLRAVVYKVVYENNTKLCHLKVLSGILKCKDKIGEDKIDQIRIYNGPKYETKDSAEANSIVVVKGLDHGYVGMGINCPDIKSQLNAYMHYDILLEDGVDTYQAYRKLLVLQEEDPSLNLRYENNCLSLSIMGSVQLEVLQEMIKNRFGLKINFTHGQINYRETITDKIEGVGHFEPLRHYSEVHLLLEPCDEYCVVNGIGKQDDSPFVKYIMNYLASTTFKGVLTNSPLTNVKITLLAYKSHLKHSETTDFKEAVNRAIRHALMRTKSVLLEPYNEFEIIVDSDNLSKCLFELENINARFMIDDYNDKHKIKGFASLKLMQDFVENLANISGGKAIINTNVCGYEPCCNQEEIVEQMAYNPLVDESNPAGSIFCKNGAGFYVPYDSVEAYMHIPYVYAGEILTDKSPNTNKHSISDEELKRVWNNTYKSNKSYVSQKPKVEKYVSKDVQKPQCLLVDGYNAIFGWSDLKEIAKNNLDSAKDMLISYMSEYQVYRYDLVVIVFDAYKVSGKQESVIRNNNLWVVYTKEKETADSFIERTVGELNKDYLVKVATGDRLEQLTSFSQQAFRVSIRELENDYNMMKKMIKGRMQKERTTYYNHALSDLRKLLEIDDKKEEDEV